MPGIMWIIANWIIASLPLDSCSSSGYVARNLRGTLEARTLTLLFSLDSHSKQVCDKSRLFHAISFFYATHLTFPEHVHRFISPARVRHAVSGEKKPIPSLTNRLMKR
jgi:hypothetical protein